MTHIPKTVEEGAATPPRPSRFPLFRELGKQYGEGVRLLTSGKVFSSRRSTLSSLYILTLFIFDAVTTVLIVTSGLGREGNPIGAFLFATVGTVGYLLVGVVTWFAPLPFCLAPPRSKIARYLAITIYIFAFTKLLAATSNLVLLIRFG